MEVATKRWIQLTHDIGRCDFPSWSPDGRHIVFANCAGRPRIEHANRLHAGRWYRTPFAYGGRSRYAELELEIITASCEIM